MGSMAFTEPNMQHSHGTLGMYIQYIVAVSQIVDLIASLLRNCSAHATSSCNHGVLKILLYITIQHVAEVSTDYCVCISYVFICTTCRETCKTVFQKWYVVKRVQSLGTAYIHTYIHSYMHTAGHKQWLLSSGCKGATSLSHQTCD